MMFGIPSFLLDDAFWCMSDTAVVEVRCLRKYGKMTKLQCSWVV